MTHKKSNDNIPEKIDSSYNAVSKKSDQPKEGQKNAQGMVYSNLYGGYVPGLYAQGRQLHRKEKAPRDYARRFFNLERSSRFMQQGLQFFLEPKICQLNQDPDMLRQDAQPQRLHQHATIYADRTVSCMVCRLPDQPDTGMLLHVR